MPRDLKRKKINPKYIESEDDSDAFIESDYEVSYISNLNAVPSPKRTKKSQMNRESESYEDSIYEISLNECESIGEESEIIPSSNNIIQRKRKRNLPKLKKSPDSIKRLTVKKKLTDKFKNKNETSKFDIENNTKKKEVNKLDPSFNIDECYFYQELPKSEWDQLKNFVFNYLRECKDDKSLLKENLEKFPKLKKGEHNIIKLKKLYKYLK